MNETSGGNYIISIDLQQKEILAMSNDIQIFKYNYVAYKINNANNIIGFSFIPTKTVNMKPIHTEQYFLMREDGIFCSSSNAFQEFLFRPNNKQKYVSSFLSLIIELEEKKDIFVAEAKADADAETKAKAEDEAKAKVNAIAKARAEAEAKARAEAEAKARAEAAAKAKAEAAAKAKAEAAAKAKAEAQSKANNRMGGFGQTNNIFDSRTKIKSNSLLGIGSSAKVGYRRVTSLPKPAYSDQNSEGTVIVNIIVNSKGEVTNAYILDGGTASESLQNSAINAAKRAKFSQGDNNSEKGTITYKFKQR